MISIGTYVGQGGSSLHGGCGTNIVRAESAGHIYDRCDKITGLLLIWEQKLKYSNPKIELLNQFFIKKDWDVKTYLLYR